MTLVPWNVLVSRFHEIGGVLRYLLRADRGFDRYVKDVDAAIDKITPSQIPNENTFTAIDTVTQKIFAIESYNYEVYDSNFPFHSKSIEDKVFKELASQQAEVLLHTSSNAAHKGLIFEALYVNVLAKQEMLSLTTTVS